METVLGMVSAQKVVEPIVERLPGEERGDMA